VTATTKSCDFLFGCWVSVCLLPCLLPFRGHLWLGQQQGSSSSPSLFHKERRTLSRHPLLVALLLSDKEANRISSLAAPHRRKSEFLCYWGD
jgi:hypothetical protein